MLTVPTNVVCRDPLLLPSGFGAHMNEEVTAQLLLEQPLIRAGKWTRTKAKSWNVGCANVPKYQYGGHIPS